MMKYYIKNNLFIAVLIMLLPLWSCNEASNDLPDEDYNALFGNEKLKVPDSGYETMPKLPCESDISQEEYIYPGKDIAEKRSYTVTLKFSYKEQNRLYDSGSKARSQVMLRYINENKELGVLKTYTDSEETEEPILKNGEEFVHKFKAQSGFPIYLGIFGAGWDIFEMKASIQATSDDGIIQTPLIEYKNKLYTDGFSPDFSFCEKIILP